MVLSSKHVQTVMVTDPDDGAIVEVEIRKDESGMFTGVEDSFLSQTDDDFLSPYGGGYVNVPDDEDPADRTLYPHIVTVNYGDGLNCGVYHYPNEKLARQHCRELLAERLGNIHADDDDGVAFRYKIATALKADDVEGALTLYGQVPDQLEVIDYNPVNFSTDSPLKGKQSTLDELLSDYLEK